jgi:hypothetical protein
VGDEVRRFCGDCKKFVHNLDALSPAEVAALRRAGGFCGTYLTNASGAFVAGRSLPMAGRISSAAAATILASVLAGCSGDESPPPKKLAVTESSPDSGPADRSAETSPESPPEDQPATSAERVKEIPPDALENLRALGYVADE